MSAPENPPAFPVIAENGLGHVSEGMSLRDWFAGQVLAGAMNTPTYWSGHLEHSLKTTPEAVAERAFKIADALLAARAKGPTS